MTLYHGTSSKVLESIARQGLLMDPAKKVFDWCASGVYVTDLVKEASYWADRAVQKHGGTPVVIEVEPHPGWLGSMEEDDGMEYDDHHWRIRSNVPLAPDTIVRVLPTPRYGARYPRTPSTKAKKELREWLLNQPVQVINIAGTQRRFTRMDAA